MTRFEPFVGLRYNQELAPLTQVIAPPYDVVDESERVALASRSPYSAIRVELPQPTGELDKYAHAAHLFHQWSDEGALLKESQRAFYIYRMTFADEYGVERSTTGVIGALGIDDNGPKTVLPHERTMPKPKGDRLDLLRATHINVSPIWGLTLATGLADILNNFSASREPDQKAKDDEGTLHELWVVKEANTISAIAERISTTPVVVADGHHRYETSGYYRSEVRETNGDRPGAHDFVMALIVELSAKELFVQGIHRVITGLPDDLNIVESLSPWFMIRSGPDDVGELSAMMVPEGALGLVTNAGNFLMVPNKRLVEKADADLDSSRLDVALSTLPTHELSYQHGVTLVADRVHRHEVQVGVLLRPATVAQIAETAHSGKRMPPKTTFFSPKPRTGMVFRPLLDEDTAAS